MNENTNQDAGKDRGQPASAGKSGRWYGTPLAAILLAVGIGAAGIAGTQAFGNDDRGWRGHGQARMADPETMARKMERGIRHLAIEIEATPAQQAALIELAKGAATDLHGFREMMRGQPGELANLLTQTTVDAAAVEAFRADKVQKVDDMTKRLAGVAVEAGEILTVEQRQKIARMVAEKRGKRGRWRH